MIQTEIIEASRGKSTHEDDSYSLEWSVNKFLSHMHDNMELIDIKYSISVTRGKNGIDRYEEKEKHCAMIIYRVEDKIDRLKAVEEL